ncbi:MAG: DNA polymerase domain-containing protein [Firmicutes bacterium]|nr:DNA polymerase domain-containing protein [Bacillota bacterium]
MPSKKDKIVSINDKNIKLTNLDKLMYPTGITKGDVIKYYHDIAEVLLPHINDRPLVMKRYPNGIEGEYFYQKECPEHAPDWVKTTAVPHSEKTVNYVVCNDLPTLLWLANLGCLEIHAWTSRINNIEYPDIAVMDLDPPDHSQFNEVLKTSLLVKKALQEFGLDCYPKTSGSRGIHLFIPIIPKYTFQEVTNVIKFIAKFIEKVYPSKTTTERVVEKREKKIYLDYLQNTRGKTMAWQYSLRPKTNATVSSPLLWEEIETGEIKPTNFTIQTILYRVKLYGDLYVDINKNSQSLDSILELL